MLSQETKLKRISLLLKSPTSAFIKAVISIPLINNEFSRAH